MICNKRKKLFPFYDLKETIKERIEEHLSYQVSMQISDISYEVFITNLRIAIKTSNEIKKEITKW